MNILWDGCEQEWHEWTGILETNGGIILLFDKTVEHRDIVMVMDGSKVMAMPQVVLPKGFSFRFFESEEDISHWARIETSVLEFDLEAEARDFFLEEFYPHIEELKRRCFFIINEEGLPIATAMGWFSNYAIPNRLHWVSVCPGFQGLGLGKAVSQKAVNVCASLLPNKPMWLSTQTESHRAVLMYHKMGFNMAKNDMKLGDKADYIKDFDAAIKVLSGLFDPSDIISLQKSAV